ncbi:MAG TPA: PepSY-associated TM helix domain-containing protein [Sphingobacteriaceae bacterium]
MIRRLGRRIYKVHKWSGLFAGIIILILGLSGSVLVFHEELEALEFRRFLTTNNHEPVSINKAYHTIAEKYPNRELRLQRFSENPNETLIFSIRHPAQRLTVFVHPSTGNIIKAIDSNKTFTTWLLTLHYSLHATLIGEIVVFIAGIAFLLSILTGIIIYRKAFMDMLLFRIKFRKKNKRSIASSLHRYVGVWALFLNIFIVLSGVLISYDIVSGGIKKRGAKSQVITSPEIKFSIDSALGVLKSQYPLFKPSYIRFPLAEGKPLGISGKVDGQSFFWSKFYNSVAIDASTGEISELKLNPSADGKTKLASIVRAVHFVEFGNFPIKLLFCLTGLSAPILSITGFLLWWWKRKNAI